MGNRLSLCILRIYYVLRFVKRILIMCFSYWLLFPNCFVPLSVSSTFCSLALSIWFQYTTSNKLVSRWIKKAPRTISCFATWSRIVMLPQSMIIVSQYKLRFNSKSGVFCQEQWIFFLSGLWRGSSKPWQAQKKGASQRWTVHCSFHPASALQRLRKNSCGTSRSGAAFQTLRQPCDPESPWRPQRRLFCRGFHDSSLAPWIWKQSQPHGRSTFCPADDLPEKVGKPAFPCFTAPPNTTAPTTGLVSFFRRLPVSSYETDSHGALEVPGTGGRDKFLCS